MAPDSLEISAQDLGFEIAAHEKISCQYDGCEFKYILNISGNTTVTGVDVDKKTCSRLFGFGGKADENNKGKTVVNFGDTAVWENGKMVDAKAYHNEGVTVDGVTYDNDVAGANDSLYAEGYKDNEVETTATEWAEQEDGSYTRTVTRKCNYCGYEKETTEIDWNVPKSIIAAACLNTKDHYSYLIGYSDGTVRPNGRITRAEVATIFFRLLTDDARQRNWSSENNFSDVSADKLCDTSLIRSLGWAPKIDLAEGLRRTVCEYRAALAAGEARL